MLSQHRSKTVSPLSRSRPQTREIEKKLRPWLGLNPIRVLEARILFCDPVTRFNATCDNRSIDVASCCSLCSARLIKSHDSRSCIDSSRMEQRQLTEPITYSLQVKIQRLLRLVSNKGTDSDALRFQHGFLICLYNGPTITFAV